MTQLITNYSFNASAKTITFSDYASIAIERIIAVRNLTTNVWIYKATDTTNYGGTVATNVLTFTASNSGMNNTDKLEIFYWAGTSLDTQLISSTDLGVQSDSSAGSDTGTFSLISLFKRFLSVKLPASLSANGNLTVKVSEVLSGVYAEDTISASDPFGFMTMAVRRDTLSTSEVSADGDNIALKATSKGQLHIAAADPIVVSQSTATDLKTQAEVYMGGSPVGNSNPLWIQMGNSSLPGAKQEDSSHASGDFGHFILGVRNDNASTSFTDTNGDYSPLAVDVNGKQFIRGIDGDVFIRQATASNLNATVVGTGTFVVQATLAAETTKVLGVTRTADGAGNLITSNSTTYTAKFAVDNNLLGTLGTAFSTAGKVDVKAADGDVFVRQSTATNLKTQSENYQGGSAVGSGNPLQVTLANTGANATAVKVDGSAVTQPVSLASIPARVRTTDSISAALATDAIMNSTTALTPKFAKIDRATNADGAAVVNLVSAKKLRVLTLTLISAGTVSYKWQSSTSNSTGTGSNTDLTGLMSLVANTGVADVFSPVGLFETVAGEALKLNLNAATQVSGYLTYVEV